MAGILEICVEDPVGIADAVAGGADRLELCSALELGGLTPSAALIDQAVATGIPIHAMIRPRSGGYVLEEGEAGLIVAEIGEALSRGVAGVVVGALRPDGRLDREAMARFRDAAADAVAVLHRAVDLAADPVAAVEEACALGYDKILSSGGAATAPEGAATLARMVTAARGRLSVMAGAGVRPDNVAALIAATGVREVHGSASRPGLEPDSKVVALGFATGARRRTDRATVAALRAMVDGGGDAMSHDLSRRGALGLGVATMIAGAVEAAADDPVAVLSTWDFGKAANQAALAAFRSGGTALDAVEAGAKVPEADPEVHTVGYGGYPDRDGHVTLDAIIMDEDGRIGAVAALEDVVHAVTVARLVMEKTPHTMLVGEGATRFALDQGMQRTNLLTPAAEKAWRDWLKAHDYRPVANIENRLPGPPGSALNHDTIGIMARGGEGHLAAACTTSGMAFKMRGRVGDSPQAGCGLFLEKGVGAAASSGVGEEVTRIAGTARVVASMRAGLSPQAACEEAVKHIARLRGDAIIGMQVGFLALGAGGDVGAFALLRGFTYAVTRHSGATELLPARSLFARSE